MTSPSRSRCSTAAPRPVHPAMTSRSSAGIVEVTLAEERWAADRVARSVDARLDAPACQRAHVGRTDRLAAVRRRADDRPGQRVLAVGLDGRRRDAEPARRRMPAAAATPLTTCAPLVRVPVLSNRTVSIERIRSRASRSLTRMPACADTAVDNEITSGIASPRACGQAMTSTVTVRTTASSTSPTADQATNVITPAAAAT